MTVIAPPTADGAYTLTAIVLAGVLTLAWIASEPTGSIGDGSGGYIVTDSGSALTLGA